MREENIGGLWNGAGRDIYENEKLPVAPGEVDYLLLTHAHIDHTGMVPKLVAGGFLGEIHATEATCRLSNIMLRDSAHIQEFEAEWRNRKGRRKGEKQFIPEYTMKDAEAAIALMVPHEYERGRKSCARVSDSCLRMRGIHFRFLEYFACDQRGRH